MSTKKESLIRSYLEEKLETGTGIQKAIAIEALPHDSLELFFNKVINDGCELGAIPSLMYHSGIHVFYDEHYYEIEQLRFDFEKKTGLSIDITGDLKSFFTWLAYEEVANIMWNEVKEELE